MSVYYWFTETFRIHNDWCVEIEILTILKVKYYEGKGSAERDYRNDKILGRYIG